MEKVARSLAACEATVLSSRQCWIATGQLEGLFWSGQYYPLIIFFMDFKNKYRASDTVCLKGDGLLGQK